MYLIKVNQISLYLTSTEENPVLLCKLPKGFDACGHNSSDYEDNYILQCAAMQLSTFNMEATSSFKIHEPTDQTHMASHPTWQ